MTDAQVWAVAEAAVIGGDVNTLERLLREHQQLLRHGQPPASTPGNLGPEYSADDARSIVAHNHHFDSWQEYATFAYALKDSASAVAQFEAAADAIVSGNLFVLLRLLDANPELIRARSVRKHHSTLMHYVGANGIEYFRQRTPTNAPEIARLLLRAGADVNATADMYGGGATTFGLAATSITPVRAGVLVPLLEALLDGGAHLDLDQAASLVNGCLHNGRPDAAQFLAARGARLDLEGAAGVGRLDLVREFFDANGLKAPTTSAQMKDAFAWACEFGHTDVVAFLLGKGVDVGARLRHHGQTGLHWAAGGGHVETVKLLLSHRAPVNARDKEWEATPIQWAFYGSSNRGSSADPSDSYYTVVALLVAAGASVEPEWLEDEKVRADPKMLAALKGER